MGKILFYFYFNEIEWFTIDTGKDWKFTQFSSCNLVIKITRAKIFTSFLFALARLWQVDAHLISSTIWFGIFFHLFWFLWKKRRREILFYGRKWINLCYRIVSCRVLCRLQTVEKYLTVSVHPHMFQFSYYTLFLTSVSICQNLFYIEGTM